jgi:hypothetical protein
MLTNYNSDLDRRREISWWHATKTTTANVDESLEW